MEDRNFEFNVLIVEDEDKWSKPMLGGLSSHEPPPRIRVDISATTADAQKRVFDKHYHVISIDQNMPEALGSDIAPQNGLSFHKICSSSSYSSKFILYTGYGAPEFANSIGVQGTRYILKSISGRDAEDGSSLSAEGWARHVRDFLSHDYIPFSLERGGQWLPLAMAERSRRALDDLKGNRPEGYVRRMVDLWDGTLHLSAALAGALCRAARHRLPNSAPRNPADIEAMLKNAWPSLVAKGWAGPWPRYIGKGGSGGAGAGNRFLDHASIPMRRFRNDLAHSYPGDWWEGKKAEIETSTLLLLDALAFWMENPLVIEAGFHPSRRTKIVGRRLSGDRYPLEEWEEDMPSATDLRPSRTDQVYIPWPKPDGSRDLLPLSPFMIVDTDPATARRSLLLLTHDAPGGKWNYRSLDSGKTQSRMLSQADQIAAESVFGAPRPR